MKVPVSNIDIYIYIWDLFTMHMHWISQVVFAFLQFCKQNVKLIHQYSLLCCIYVLFCVNTMWISIPRRALNSVGRGKSWAIQMWYKQFTEVVDSRISQAYFWKYQNGKVAVIVAQKDVCVTGTGRKHFTLENVVEVSSSK